MKADVPLALDVLSDILANPSFVPDELEREKSVIVQEIGAAQDTPTTSCSSISTSSAFPTSRWAAHC
jgi:predicted Zn-dependent peptidase